MAVLCDQFAITLTLAKSIFLQKPREDRLPETAAARTQLNPLDEAQLDMTSYDELDMPKRLLTEDLSPQAFHQGKSYVEFNTGFDAVFSLPLLWSSLSIESWHLYGRPALAGLVVTYISRSGNVPLKIHLKSEEDIPEVELQVFDALLEHVSRWQEATLYISLPWLLHAKTKLGSRLFPVLDVQHNSQSNQDLTRYFPNQIIQSSPKLSIFHGLGYDSSFSPRGFGGTYGDHSRVTNRFPMLEICSTGGFRLSEDASNGIGLEDDIPIYTSKITHLYHAAPWDTFQEGAWQFLRIPDLTSLELRHNGYSLTQVSSLLSSSGNGELGLLDQLTTGLTFVTDRWPVVPNLLSFELSWSDWGYKRLRDLNTMALQTVLRNAICGMVESRLSVSGNQTQAQGLQRLALRIRDGDFLEFELLYEAIGNKLSCMEGFDFETLTPQFSCVKTHSASALR
ncbi:uncharacterized protein C8R40DRAFT_1070735 [Lentinula edodes]|uniref:uncharacterized protein n=1 Tax=Lentinula edodes TaxID=5353 RepID=UPI001E8ED533|nr:uncharacterized protein C8R40DRAFT_1070735 [Lentinula edodes]KAH7873904.1 hypothetical protein C8R40DRAFT_1070735 [Lentinula edodes]